MNEMKTCTHTVVACINQYELIRKYRCATCAGVMMCACDEAFGQRFLGHQLSEGSDLRTRRGVPVTLGFQPNVCAECRGLAAVAAPTAQIHGRTSKIKRYYWREIHFATTQRKADWDTINADASANERCAHHDTIETQVLDEIKTLHKNSPKYNISEPSQDDLARLYSVDIIPIFAEYVDAPKKGAVIRNSDKAVSPEVFAAQYFEAQGWSTLPLESVPFHCLFGVMMWLLIQDPADRLVLNVCFGDRNATEARCAAPPIWTRLPEDFGSEGYGDRRKRAIAKHFKILTAERDELLWLFDYWRDHSSDFRQYIWAHRDRDVDRARRLIEILPPQNILCVLRYLVESYWERYLGWPDLLIYRGREIMLLEVKSSGDKLSNDQKRWIADNYQYLHFPFKITKIHRKRSDT